MQNTVYLVYYDVTPQANNGKIWKRPKYVVKYLTTENISFRFISKMKLFALDA